VASDKTIAWVMRLKPGCDEKLPELTKGSHVYVIKRDDGFYLYLPFDEAGESYEKVTDVAQEWIPLLNGAYVSTEDFSGPMELDSFNVSGIDAEGNLTDRIVNAGTAHLRIRGGTFTMQAEVWRNGELVIDEETEQQELIGAMATLLEKVKDSDHKKQALIIIGTKPPTWTQLFVAFELVEDDVGGSMFDMGWISKDDANLFGWTLNNHETLGIDGRHGPKKGYKPPPKPMTHEEAVRLIKKLILAWINHSG
jgi:hypothetical protein